MAEQALNCYDCRHFYVTWDEGFPRGCRLLGFKSRRMPSEVVRESSGLECQSFAPKEGRGGAEGTGVGGTGGLTA